MTEEEKKIVVVNFVNSCILESMGNQWTWTEVVDYIDEYFEPLTDEELEYLEEYLDD